MNAILNRQDKGIDPGLLPVYSSAAALASVEEPAAPVYCLYPHVLSQDAQAFLQGFPGPTLYAVKANPSPHVLRRLRAEGVRHYDTASVPEIAATLEAVPDAHCYYMSPVRLRGAAAAAYHDFGVRDFVVDCAAELENVLAETGARDLTIYVRLATSSVSSVLDLSRKFGADRKTAAALLQAVDRAGARAALSFHVGSLCLSTQPWGEAFDAALDVAAQAKVPLVYLNVGGGFPTPYPGLDVPPLRAYLKGIRDRFEAAQQEDLVDPATKLMCEPGRALSAKGMSVLTQVLRRSGQTVFINDGVYGSFCETVQLQPAIQFPTAVYRETAGEMVRLEGERAAFRCFGPTCDSVDVLPWEPPLPLDIQAGDYVEFGLAGAYSFATRTGFNGYTNERFAVIGEGTAFPPGVSAP